MSKLDSYEAPAIVQAIFSSRDPRRADRIQSETIKSAKHSGIDTRSEGYYFTQRHLNFRLEPNKLSRFCNLVQAHCQRLHLELMRSRSTCTFRSDQIEPQILVDLFVAFIVDAFSFFNVFSIARTVTCA